MAVTGDGGPVAPAPRRTVPDDERRARAALSRAAEPGQPDVPQLLARYGPVEAWARLRSGAGQATGGRLAAAAARARVADPVADLAALADVGGRLLCPGDEDWPVALSGYGPAFEPVALWVRGTASLAALAGRAVAVVGTRAASEYGLYVAGELAAGLADRGWAIVSGGAYGIDGAAHRGCLVMGGSTAAVLACGVDVSYPRGHAGLFARIAERGLLVSELPPGSAPYRVRFLQRNRLIAALAAGTVVVEAGQRSGALSTAAHAGRLHRPVAAVPGPVTAATSAGCHRLIREARAVLVTGVADVLDVVGRIGDDLAPPPEKPVGVRDQLPPDVARVLDAVPVRRGVEASRIATAAGSDPSGVLAALGLLEGFGLVEPHGPGWRLTVAAREPPRPPATGDGGQQQLFRLPDADGPSGGGSGQRGAPA
jgi:DNA processing protein